MAPGAWAQQNSADAQWAQVELQPVDWSRRRRDDFQRKFLDLPGAESWDADERRKARQRPRPAAAAGRPVSRRRGRRRSRGEGRGLAAVQPRSLRRRALLKRLLVLGGPAAGVKRRRLSQEAARKVALPLSQEAARKALGICIEDLGSIASAPCPVESFEELELPRYAIDSLASNGIVAPLPIQAQAMPLVLAGCDVIGLAQTGSGKTLAFLLPAVPHIEAQAPIGWKSATPIALVMAPTRELAVQISDEAVKVLKGSNSGNHRNGLWSTVLYGGGKKYEQEKSARGAHIMVATPGRLIDFLSSGVVSLERVTYLVLDEADRMLDMGFSGDVDAISGQVRPERQVLFFSATWSSAVQELARGLCHEGARPVRISYGQGRDSTNGADCNAAVRQAREGIVQQVVVVDFPKEQWERQVEEKARLLDRHLHEVLEASEDHKVLVFVSQKGYADELSNKLWEAGFKAGAIHGGKPQESRLWTLDQFRKGALRLLVATDVIGRGIDIPDVSHVVVFDMGSVEDYIHRIGRTARGKDAKGHALVFFEYYYKEPNIAQELAEVLEASKQVVPEELKRIVREVAQGKRETLQSTNSKWGGGDWKSGGGGGGWKNGGGGGGNWNASAAATSVNQQPRGGAAAGCGGGGGQTEDWSRNGQRGGGGAAAAPAPRAKKPIVPEEEVPDNWEDSD